MSSDPPLYRHTFVNSFASSASSGVIGTSDDVSQGVRDRCQIRVVVLVYWRADDHDHVLRDGHDGRVD